MGTRSALGNLKRGDLVRFSRASRKEGDMAYDVQVAFKGIVYIVPGSTQLEVLRNEPLLSVGYFGIHLATSITEVCAGAKNMLQQNILVYYPCTPFAPTGDGYEALIMDREGTEIKMVLYSEPYVVEQANEMAQRNQKFVIMTFGVALVGGPRIINKTARQQSVENFRLDGIAYIANPGRSLVYDTGVGFVLRPLQLIIGEDTVRVLDAAIVSAVLSVFVAPRNRANLVDFLKNLYADKEAYTALQDGMCFNGSWLVKGDVVIGVELDQAWLADFVPEWPVASPSASAGIAASGPTNTAAIAANIAATPSTSSGKKGGKTFANAVMQ